MLILFCATWWIKYRLVIGYREASFGRVAQVRHAQRGFVREIFHNEQPRQNLQLTLVRVFI
jgi:hypothetical protein